jgi:glycosyltransferase involved in cell wall biosynthesis
MAHNNFLESDIILNCSHYEGESNAIIEAMYYAKPLIVSNTPGNSPLINDMNDGLLFDVNDSDEFGRKAQLLLTNKNLKKKLYLSAMIKSKKE